MNNQDMEFELYRDIDRYLNTLSKYYGKLGKNGLQKIIVNSKAKVHTGWSYDNWDGGISGHALYLSMPEAIYLEYVYSKNNLQTIIKQDLNDLHNIRDEFIEEVFFEMDVPDDPDWRKDSGLLINQSRSIPNPVTRRIWGVDGFRVFLSHKSEVKKETSILKEDLKLYGITSFVAHEDIHPTKEWQNEIENALHTKDSFVVLLTSGFHNSNWTDQEVGFAISRGVPIISVKLGMDPYGFIGKFQALSCTWAEAPSEIAKLLIKREPMVNAYINAIRVCSDYDDANKLAELLPFIERFSETQIEVIMKAFNDNSQVYDSYGFNGQNKKRFGDGLLFHLQRLSDISLQVSPQGKILKIQGTNLPS